MKNRTLLVLLFVIGFVGINACGDKQKMKALKEENKALEAMLKNNPPQGGTKTVIATATAHVTVTSLNTSNTTTTAGTTTVTVSGTNTSTGTAARE